MRKFLHSMFFRMMLLLMVVSIPILIAGMAINIAMYDRIVRKNLSHARYAAESSAESLFSQTKGLISLAGDLVNLPAVKALSGREGSSADLADEIVTVQRFAYSLLNSTLLANDVEIFFPSRNFIISGLTDGTRNFDGERYAELLEVLSGPEPYRLRSLSGGIRYCFRLSPFTVEGRSPEIVCLTFSRSAIVRTLAESGERTGNFDFLDVDGDLLCADGGTERAQALREFAAGLSFSSGAAQDRERYMYCFRDTRLGLSWYTSVERSSNQNDLTFYLILSGGFLLVSVGLIIFSAYKIRNLFIRPLNQLVSGLERVGKGEFDARMDVHTDVAEIRALYDHFNRTAERLRALLDEVREDAVRLQMSELKQLQYQINPHFLYNTLHIIHCMADAEDYDGIVSLTRHLNEFYQYLTKVKGDSTLGAELVHMKGYVSVQELRFGERIRAEIEEPPPELREISMPSLVLQPLVENVYTHGLKQRETGGVFRVRFSEKGGFCRISVEDNGESLTEEALETLKREISDPPPNLLENIALVNIRRRLELKFGRSDLLVLGRSELGGLCVTVCIPLKEQPSAGEAGEGRA